MQTLQTKNYGPLTFVKTWVGSMTHIGLLANGGYCNVGGPPIESLVEIKNAIPAGQGQEREKAINWWMHKDDVVERAEKVKRIVILPNGDFQFDDGSLIQEASDLVAFLPPGPLLNTALAWFAGKQKSKEAVNEKEKQVIKERSAEEVGNIARKRCQAIKADGTQCKRMASKGSDYCNLPAHQKLSKKAEPVQGVENKSATY